MRNNSFFLLLIFIATISPLSAMRRIDKQTYRRKLSHPKVKQAAHIPMLISDERPVKDTTNCNWQEYCWCAAIFTVYSIPIALYCSGNEAMREAVKNYKLTFPL